MNRLQTRSVVTHADETWFVVQPARLWHCFVAMTSKRTHSGFAGKAMLAVLLLSVVSSGIPMVEVHSHDNATFGHTHHAHGHDHDVLHDHGAGEFADSGDGDVDTSNLHAHDLSATGASLISSVSAEFAAPEHSHSHIPPPRTWLPDNVIAPLYRPPIA